MLTVSIIGKSLNEALALTKPAIEQDESGIRLLADNTGIALDIKKFLEAQSYNVMLEDDNGKIILTSSKVNYLTQNQNLNAHANLNTNVNPIQTTANLNTIPATIAFSKMGALANQNSQSKNKGTFAILITGKNFSRENKKYGRVFLKRVIESLTQLKQNPDVIAFMNEGVKLALYNSASCDFLKELEAKGSRVMISGMCADNFGLTESIGVGIIANIADIIDAVSACDKVLSF